MSDILDRGSLLFSSVAVLLISFALGHSLAGFGFSFYVPLFVLAVIYTPGVLLIGGWVGQASGSFRSAFQRDYAPLLTCAAAAWTAALSDTESFTVTAWLRGCCWLRRRIPPGSLLIA